MHAYSLLSTRRRQGTAVEKTSQVPRSEEQETRRVQPTCEHAENTDRDRLASPSPCNMDPRLNVPSISCTGGRFHHSSNRRMSSSSFRAQRLPTASSRTPPPWSPIPFNDGLGGAPPENRRRSARRRGADRGTHDSAGHADFM